jgi:hypothetical protein
MAAANDEASPWATTLFSWVQDDCRGELGTSTAHVTSQHGVPSREMLVLMKDAVAVSGQQLEVRSTAKRQREPDEPGSRKRVKLITPTHGKECVCGQLTHARDVSMAGKLDVASLDNVNPADFEHISLAGSLHMNSRVALMLGTAAQMHNACVHVWCPTTHIASVVCGSKSAPLLRLNLSGMSHVPSEAFKCDAIRTGTRLLHGVVLGETISKHDIGRAVCTVACVDGSFGVHGPCVVKLDHAGSSDCRNEVGTLLELQSVTACVVRVYKSFSIRHHPVLGTFTATMMEQLTPMSRLTRRKKSVRTAMLLIRGIAAGLTVQKLMLQMGVLNLDIRIANMGVTLSEECLAATVGKMCCPCRVHGHRGLDVRIFDTGLVAETTGAGIEKRLLLWLNRNMSETAEYIIDALSDKEYVDVIAGVIALRASVKMSTDTRDKMGIIVSRSTQKTWHAEYVRRFEQHLDVIMSARVCGETMAAKIDKWCMTATRDDVAVLCG